MEVSPSLLFLVVVCFARGGSVGKQPGHSIYWLSGFGAVLPMLQMQSRKEKSVRSAVARIATTSFVPSSASI